MNSSPTVATIVAIFAVAEGRLQVLLVLRTGEPEAGTWALPGGLWDCNESLNESATRKLVEETGASDVYLEQLFTISGLDVSRDAVAVAYSHAPADGHSHTPADGYTHAYTRVHTDTVTGGPSWIRPGHAGAVIRAARLSHGADDSAGRVLPWPELLRRLSAATGGAPHHTDRGTWRGW